MIETRKKGIEKIVLQILVQFAGTYLRVSGKQSSLNLSIFLFLFCRNVSEFI